MSIQDLDERYIPLLESAVGESSLSIVPLAGDASNRRYFRVGGGDHTWVLMVWEPFDDDEDYPFLSVLNHFRQSGVQVPAVIKKFPEQGMILLEDLGDLTLERKFWEFQNEESIIPYYRLAIDELIKIHYGASSKQGACTAFKIAFDVEKLLWEMNYGQQHLIEKLSDVNLTAAEKSELSRIFSDICKKLHEQPKLICHRDYHSRNLMLKLNKMRVIDFQDARMGPIHYDLVSLLKDSYVNLTEKTGQKLIDYYFQRRSEFAMPEISKAEFSEIYEIQSIQRCFKACGSFASFFNMRGDKRYLKYLPATLKRVNESLELFPEYRAFKEILDSYGILERDFEIT